MADHARERGYRGIHRGPWKPLADNPHYRGCHTSGPRPWGDAPSDPFGTCPLPTVMHPGLST